jgi:hypothetical protein
MYEMHPALFLKTGCDSRLDRVLFLASLSSGQKKQGRTGPQLRHITVTLAGFMEERIVERASRSVGTASQLSTSTHGVAPAAGTNSSVTRR